MHRQAKQWMAAAAVAAAVLFVGASGVAAQGGAGGGGGRAGGGGGNAPADPPPIAYRKAMMQNNAQHIAALRAAIAGAADKNAIKMHADAIDNNGKMWASIFPAGSTGATSRAKDEIWTMKDDFAAKVKAFADAAHGVKEAADKGDNAGITAALQTLNGTCGGCHMPYRKPAAPPPAG